MGKNKKKWYRLEEILENMRSGQCAVSLQEESLLCLHGDFLDQSSTENLVFCRIAGATQIAEGSQIPVSFCKL